jgi:hypothetical protein
MNLDELQALYERTVSENEADPGGLSEAYEDFADLAFAAFPTLRAELLEARQLLREASETIEDVCVKTDVYLGIGEAHDRVRKWEAAYSAWEAKWTA